MFYQESGHITCWKYLQKQSEKSCCTRDGTTTFPIYKEIKNVNTKSPM